jgi:hypothetical protein
MDIISFEFIALLALVVASVTQISKYHPKITGNLAPYVSVFFGLVLSFGWFLVKGDLRSSHAPLHVDWMNAYRAFCNGVVAVTTAAAGYVAQKAAPFPNLLPTTTEINAQKIKDEVTRQEMVVEAVKKGVEPETAKDKVGLDENDPPPTEVLEQIQPTLPPTDGNKPIG